MLLEISHPNPHKKRNYETVITYHSKEYIIRHHENATREEVLKLFFFIVFPNFLIVDCDSNLRFTVILEKVEQKYPFKYKKIEVFDDYVIINNETSVNLKTNEVSDPINTKRFEKYSHYFQNKDGRLIVDEVFLSTGIKYFLIIDKNILVYILDNVIVYYNYSEHFFMDQITLSRTIVNIFFKKELGLIVIDDRNNIHIYCGCNLIRSFNFYLYQDGLKFVDDTTGFYLTNFRKLCFKITI